MLWFSCESESKHCLNPCIMRMGPHGPTIHDPERLIIAGVPANSQKPNPQRPRLKRLSCLAGWAMVCAVSGLIIFRFVEALLLSPRQSWLAAALLAVRGYGPRAPSKAAKCVQYPGRDGSSTGLVTHMLYSGSDACTLFVFVFVRLFLLVSDAT